MNQNAAPALAPVPVPVPVPALAPALASEVAPAPAPVPAPTLAQRWTPPPVLKTASAACKMIGGGGVWRRIN